VGKCILQFISGTKLPVCQKKLKRVDVTFVIKKAKLFVYLVGQMRKKLAKTLIVTLTENRVFMGIALSQIDAPVKSDGKVSLVTNVSASLVV